MNPIIYENVHLGEGAIIEPFCIIGQAPRGKKEGEVATYIGAGAHIRSHTVIYAGNKIGDNFSTGHHVCIREDNSIGNNVSVGTLSCVEHHVVIEDGVRIHSQAFIPEYSILRQDAWIGPNVVLTNSRYPRSKRSKEMLSGVEIGSNAKVGANTTILPGIHIGDNALVGAGSVVSRNVDVDKVVFGNPAKVHGSVVDITEYTEE